MPGACTSLWPTEECEWSSWDIWRSSDIVVHAIYIILALMLGYTFFVLVRFSVHYYTARHELLTASSGLGSEHLRNRRRILSNLRQGLVPLKGIASTAPFLGLAGTGYGILAALWFSYSGSPDRYIALLFTRIAFAFTATLAGILVAIPAILAHCLLHARIEAFPDGPLTTDHSVSSGISFFRRAQTLPLKKRFSSLPPFALFAAPTLACIVALFTPFHPYRTPTGLFVGLVSDRCKLEGDRPMVLRISNAGQLSINQEPADWETLTNRLSAIFGVRERRTLYLLSEDGVLFQRIADAVDIAENALPTEASSPRIRVLLITPAEMEGCLVKPKRSVPATDASIGSLYSVALGHPLR